MSELPAPRPLAQRKTDSLARLENDKDLWIATGDTTGAPCMVPLSFWWDGYMLYVATAGKNPTSLNIQASGLARVVLGHTRDVTLIDVRARKISNEEATDKCADAYTQKCGWDPRNSKGYFFFELVPVRVEAWRELNEHVPREIMTAGVWTA
jgi:hypothetical protein